MTAEEKAFRDAIAENRRDMDLRKIFADWLDEHGRDEEAQEQRDWTVEKQESIEWLENFAEEMGYDGADKPENERYYGPRRKMTYELLMQSAREWLEHGEYLTEMGSERWRDDLSGYLREGGEFWTHYQRATGSSVPERKQCSFFSCSC